MNHGLMNRFFFKFPEFIGGFNGVPFNFNVFPAANMIVLDLFLGIY